MRDVIVMGAGLAGLCAAIKCAKAGQKVTLTSKGIGGLQLGQGTIDVLGYSPDRVTEPLAGVEHLLSSDEGHPYAKVGVERVRTSVEWLRDLLGEDVLVGDLDHNYQLPTAVGAIRPTALAQPSMLAGQLKGDQKYVFVGFTRLKDFYPKLIADNLNRSRTPEGEAVAARAVDIDFEIRPGEYDTTGLNHARAFDDPQVRAKLVAAVKPLLEPGEIVGFPAVLGLNDATAWRDIASQLGHEVFEVPLPPPSVPGMRLNQRLTQIAKDAGVRIILGSAAVHPVITDGAVHSVRISSAGRQIELVGKHFILATGGFESGSLQMDSFGEVTERVFGLPLVGLEGQLVHGDYWGDDQPLFRVGVDVDDQMRPKAADGSIVYPNLHAVGGLLAGATRWRDKSGDGIAVATALAAADSILGSLS